MLLCALSENGAARSGDWLWCGFRPWDWSRYGQQSHRLCLRLLEGWRECNDVLITRQCLADAAANPLRRGLALIRQAGSGVEDFPIRCIQPFGELCRLAQTLAHGTFRRGHVYGCQYV